jgi:uncharacterized protein (TIGR03437 family)
MNKDTSNTRLGITIKAALTLFALGCLDTASAQTNTFTATPGSLSFCGTTASSISPSALNLTVGTASGQVENYAISSNVPWLSLSNATGTAPGSGVAVIINQTAAASLPTGVSTGLVTISGTGYTSLVVQITLTLGANCASGTGAITSDTSSITSTVVANAQDVKSFNITNDTNASLNVTATVTQTVPTSQPWLRVTPGVATLPVNSPMQFTVNIFPAGILTPGQSYTATVTITPQTSGLAAIVIPVTLNYATGTGNTALISTPPVIAYPLPTGTSAATSLSVTNNSNTVVFLKAIMPSVPWLTVTPVTDQQVNIGNSANFTVTFNAAGLSPTNYNTTIQIVDDSNNTSGINVPVTLCVGSTTCQATGTSGAIFNSAPASLTFTVAPNSVTPQTTTLAITSNNSSAVVASATSSSPSWLTVNPATATVNAGTATNFTVTVNPANLPAGPQATSTITFSPLSASGLSLSVPVTVNVAAVPVITSTPAAFSFAYQTGTAIPLPQTLLLSSNSPGQFQVQGTTNNGGSWLVISPQSGATAGAGAAPTPVTVQVNPSTLTPNTYTGQVVVTNSATGITQNTPVTLLVSALPIVSFNNSETDFSYQYQSATLPIQQSVAVTSSGNPVNFLTQITPNSGGNWLVVSPTTGTTPQNLSLSLNPQVLAGLAPGKFQSTIDLDAQGAGNSPSYTVVLTITNSTSLNASQGALVFNRELFQSPAVAQTFTVTSSGSPLQVTVGTQSGSNACGNFLSASPSSGTTPLVVTVSVTSNALGVAGTCTGNVSVTSANAGNSPLNVPVTLNISNTALLNVSPSAINVTAQQGSTPPSQTVALTSTDPNTQVTFTVTSVTMQGTGWLLVGPTGGTTPMNLSIGYKTSGLSPGTYNGNITVTATTPSGVADSPITIPVTLVITTGNTASVTPASLTFSQSMGGPAPGNQSLMIASAQAGLSFSATATVQSGSGWLSISGSSSGTTPGSLSVAVNGASLNTGSYSGTITIVIAGAANSPINVPVSLVIGPAQALSVSNTAVNFSYVAGASTSPAAQTIQVASNTGALAFTAAVATPTGTPAFLTVAPASGTTNASVSIGLVQSVISTLAAGSYTGTVTISSAAGMAVINVTLTVTAAGAPSIGAVVNGASDIAGPVSPGEIISIYGTNIGPGTPAGLLITAGGTVATTLSNTQVTFDGTAAPLIYVSSNQINAIVPYQITPGQGTTNVVVSTNGLVSPSMQLQVAATAPGVFTAGQGGSGQGAILNQDNITPNSSSKPAPKGSVVVIYATGEGLLKPQPPTGSFTPGNGSAFIVPINMVSIQIGGQQANIEFAGEAPTLVSGVLQVNAVVPLGIGSGPQPIQLTVGNNTNLTQVVTVYVQ